MSALAAGNLVCGGGPRVLGGGAPTASNSNRACVSCRYASSLVRLSSVNRPWGSFALQNLEAGERRLRAPLLVAQNAAAQTEATEEDEENEELVEEAPTNGAADSSLLDDLRAALAANDEASIAGLEGQLRALEEEKENLAKQVFTLIEEAQVARDRLLRLNADFENFRRRSETEKSNLSSSVKGDVIETLLPMVDNFERAKASIRLETEGEQAIDRSYQGIYKQFVEIMKGLGVVAIETVGRPFDPNLHEAIMREESAEYQEGIVIQEFRRGFSIGSKLVRPAMVKVSAGPGANGDTPVALQEEVAEEVN